MHTHLRSGTVARHRLAHVAGIIALVGLYAWPARAENFVLHGDDCMLGSITVEDPERVVVKVVGRMPDCLTEGGGTVKLAKPTDPPVTFTRRELLIYGRTLPSTPDHIELSPLSPPFDGLAPARTADGNAADEYIEAIRAISARLDLLGVTAPADYQKALPLTEEEITHLLAGSRRKTSAFAPTYFSFDVAGTEPELPIVSVHAIARGLVEHGHDLQTDRQGAQAEVIYQSLIVFGWHLAQEPRSVIQHMLGLASEALGCQAMEKWEESGGTQHPQIYAHCREGVQERTKTINQKRATIEADATFARRTAEHDPDAMWRRYAVRFVYMHVDPSANGETEQLLQRIAKNDADDSVRKAAELYLKRLTSSPFVKIAQAAQAAPAAAH